MASFDDPKEYVDSATGEILGTKTYRECRKGGLWMRTVEILLFRDASYQDLVLQQRSLSLPIMPSRLHVPGGFVDPEESPAQAAFRELREEMYVGSDPPPGLELEELFSFSAEADGTKTWSTLFCGVHPRSFSPDPKEVAAAYFCRLDRVLRTMERKPGRFTEKCILVLREYAKRYGVTRG